MVREQVTDRLLLVGTAHVSPESVREVEAAVAEFRPDVVAVELDAGRLEALEDKQRWESTPFHKLLKSDKLWLFLTQILLASYQRRLGEEYGAEPGAEMLAAVRAARAQNVDVLLADRDVGLTMKRAARSMRAGEKFRLSWELFKALLGASDEEEAPKTAQELTQEDAVTSMMNELGQIAPSIKSVVIDERDAYLATRVQEPLAAGKRVVAVVGAGHLPGIRKRIQTNAPPANLRELETIPEKKFNLGKVLGWSFPILLVGLFGYFAYEGVTKGNWAALTDFLLELLLWGGGLAALGCLLAFGHPLSILTAFVVAPFTILHPGLAAGWFSGLVEAWIREPRVLDFQALSRIKRMRDFFRNRVIRVLMVAALTNVGAMIGASIVVGKGLGSFFGAFRSAGRWIADWAAAAAGGDPRSLVILVAVLLVVALLVLRRRRKAPA